MSDDANQIGVLRALSHLSERLGLNRMMGGDSNRRNLNQILRRKKTLTFQDFYDRYDRKDIAGRINDAWPDATWRKAPELVENEEGDETAFEKAYKDLQRRLQVHSYFSRVDKLAGLGRYAVLLIGTKGGTSLKTPLTQGQFKDPKSIIYLNVFSEKHATIKTYVTKASDERFGKPELYEIDFSSSVEGFKGLSKTEIHWTRVIHVAEDLLDSEIFGRPRLRRVFDLLEDLEKVGGGAAEMFYQGADRGLNADVRDNFQLTDDDKKAVKEHLELYADGLNRVLRTQGMDVKTLGGTTADPTGPGGFILDLISGTSGIPKRLLLGSERGELASTTDESSFNGRVEERRQDFAEPVILRAFVDRLIWLGALPEPQTEEGYTVNWPSLFEKSDSERASIAKDVALAARTLSPNDPTRVIAISEFRDGYLNLPEELPEGEQSDDDDDEALGDDPKTTDDEAVIPTVQDVVEGEAA